MRSKNERTKHTRGHGWMALALSAAATVLMMAASAVALGADIQLANRKSGISVSLSGTSGVDWAVERTCHDPSLADEIIYLKPAVQISLAHNDRNSIMISTPLIPHVVGVAGLDGVTDSGDEGDIHWKLDRDMQSHIYAGTRGTLPSYAVRYTTPFRLDSVTYDGSRPVLGSVGDNGGPWGTQPLNTTARWAYGQRDQFANEWHTLTYWDNDVPMLTAAGVSPHRQGASDGHLVMLCPNPVTPVMQFVASDGAQFYTTPLKTYHVPRIWPRTTYVTSEVRIEFVNLTNAEPVKWRVDGGMWAAWDGTGLRAGDLFSSANVPHLLEAKCGDDGVTLQRTVVLNPDYPGPQEEHGYLLFADEAERQRVRDRVHNVQPFKTSYTTFRGSWYQGMPATFDDTRGGWCSGAGLASTSLANAFVIAMEGAAVAEANVAKQRLLRVGRLEPVGFETTVSNATPSKDFLNELGQTLQQFADAGVAYDIAARWYRQSDIAGGMTPIEEIYIRDGLARIAKSILQFRGNYSATSGGGDTHWAHGYELAFGTIALAMPTYRTPCFGASGGDRLTANDQPGADGKYWNPFPDQGVAWYQAATDSQIATPGHPNVIYPFRAEFLLTDDGWWSGPNDLQGDGDRYVTGPMGSRLVDVKYGGLANAECRVELVEMSGYESPFVKRVATFDFMRRIRGDQDRARCVTAYLRRRLVNGVVPLAWDSVNTIYTTGEPRVESAVYTFNRHYEFAALPGPRALVGQFMTELLAYYGYGGTIDQETRDRLEQDRKTLYDAYALALCEDPAELPAHEPERWNHRPVLKPLFKSVVAPGQTIYKTVIAFDPDGDPLTLTVDGLPPAASWNPAARTIVWIPGAGDSGVHVVTVTATDGRLDVSRPFAMIVKADAGSGPIPAAPTSVTATRTADDAGVVLNWTPPAGVQVAGYAVYRDGVLWQATGPAETGVVDRERISPSSHTRYHVALWSTYGGESSATDASPAIVDIPPAGDPEVDLEFVDGVDWAYQNTAQMLAAGGHSAALVATVTHPHGNEFIELSVGKADGSGPGQVIVEPTEDPFMQLVVGGLRSDGITGTGFLRLAVRIEGDAGGAANAEVPFIVRPLGDINGDGSVTTADSVELSKRLNGLVMGRLAYDLDGDGAVTTSDSVLLSKVLNGLGLQ